MSCEVFSLTTWLLEPPEKPSIAIATAVQFKTFYRTCSAMRVLLMAGLVGLSTSDRILTSYDNVVSGDGAELYAALYLPPWAPWFSPWSTLSLPGACLIDG